MSNKHQGLVSGTFLGIKKVCIAEETIINTREEEEAVFSKNKMSKLSRNQG